MRIRLLLATGIKRPQPLPCSQCLGRAPKGFCPQKKAGRVATTLTSGSPRQVRGALSASSLILGSDSKSIVKMYSAFSLLCGPWNLNPMGSCFTSSSWLSTPHPVRTDCHQYPLTDIRKVGVGGLSEDSDSQEMQRQQCRPRLGVGKGVAATSLLRGPRSRQPSCS